MLSWSQMGEYHLVEKPRSWHWRLQAPLSPSLPPWQLQGSDLAGMKSGCKNIEWLSQRQGMGLAPVETAWYVSSPKSKIVTNHILFYFSLCNGISSLISLLHTASYHRCVLPAKNLLGNSIPQPRILPPAKPLSMTCYSWLVLTSFNILTLFWN